MSGAGRFSLFDDSSSSDDESEFLQNPISGSFSFPFDTPNPTPAPTNAVDFDSSNQSVNPPITESYEPFFPLTTPALFLAREESPNPRSESALSGTAGPSIQDITAPIESIPEESISETSLVVSHGLPRGTSEPSEERAKFTTNAFLATGSLDATNQAIEEFKTLLNADPALPTAERVKVTEMLGAALLQRFESYKDVDDMEEAVEIHMQVAALSLEDADPALRAKSLAGLGRTLTSQFEHTGDSTHAELAIDHLNRALQIMPPGHPDRPAVLADFARAELAQYAHSHDSKYLQQALSRCEEAFVSAPMESPERASLSGILGRALLSRFERTHSPEDIARSVECLEFAVVNATNGNPEQPKQMRSYGDAVLARSVFQGNLDGLNTAIDTHEAALELLTPERAAYPAIKESLGKAFFARFRRTKHIEDLDRAIENLKIAAEYSSFTDAQYPYTIELLGNLYVEKYQATAQPTSEDFVDYAIALLNQSITLTPPEHPHYNRRCESLENVTRIKNLLLVSQPSKVTALKLAADSFLATGNLQAASQAVAESKAFLNQGPEMAPATRVEVAEVLTTVLSKRFEYFGDVDDIEKAVETQIQVIALALEEGADPALRAKCHGGLGRTLTAQFEHTGDPDDAELAIDHLNRALRMMPPGHPDRPAVLADFARAELAQYAHSDDPNRLQQALARCEEALNSVPMEAPERTPLSGLLGGALLSRFERTHSPEDVVRAVEYLNFAVTNTLEGNPELPKRMRSYGDALLARSVIEGDLGGLNVAIRTQETALALLTPEHAAYPAITGSLAKAFHTRFRITNDVEDLDKAIDKFKTTAEFTPFTDPNHARITDLLGKSFMAKYRAATQTPRAQFLDYAITLHRQAVALTSPDHRHYADRLESLGKAYSKRYRSMLRRQSATESDLQEAERCLREAMSRDPSRADNILHKLKKLNL